MVGHRVEHLAVRVSEPHVVLKEVDVASDVGHHHLLGDVLIALKQVGVGGIGIDHHLVDGAARPDVPLKQLVELHAEAPMGIAGGEAAEGRGLVECAVVEHLIDDREEVEPIVAGDLLDLLAGGIQLRRKTGALHM